MKLLRGVLLSVLLILFMPCRSIFGEVATLKNGPVIVKKSTVHLQDIAESLNLQINPIIAKNPSSPFYIQSSRLQKRLPGSFHVQGRGVWVIPHSKKIKGQKLVSLIEKRMHLADRAKEAEILLEKYKISVNSTTVLYSPPATDHLKFNFPSGLSRITPGSMRIAVDTMTPGQRKTGFGSAGSVPKSLHRQFISFSLTPRLPEPQRRKQNLPVSSTELFHGNERTASVQRGDRIRVFYRSGSIEITLPGIAGGAGKQGEVIAVNIVFPSGKTTDNVKARIQGNGTLMVVPPEDGSRAPGAKTLR